MNPDLVQLVLVTVVTAATPLFLAALGELVAERSGVLNLGVEGMMVMGAACAFAAAYLTGSTLLGAVAGTAVGALTALLFGLLTVVFAVSQVAAGRRFGLDRSSVGRFVRAWQTGQALQSRRSSGRPSPASAPG